MHKQGALRTLAALARASFSSHPDDPTYIGGLLVTLQSMLDSLDQIRARSGALASFVAQSGSQPSSTSKASIAEFRARMEVWALMRCVGTHEVIQTDSDLLVLPSPLTTFDLSLSLFIYFVPLATP